MAINKQIETRQGSVAEHHVLDYIIVIRPGGVRLESRIQSYNTATDFNDNHDPYSPPTVEVDAWANLPQAVKNAIINLKSTLEEYYIIKVVDDVQGPFYGGTRVNDNGTPI